jgi:probable HAF family extracellular repeat protein
MRHLHPSFLLAAAATTLSAQQSPSVSTGLFTDLGTFGGNYSCATGVSADGSVVVGQANNASNQYHPFRWTAGVMTDLGNFGGNYSDANAVSADGSVVVGRAYNASNQYRAFRWTAGVMTDLGTLGGNYSNANAVSADGSVVVGQAYNASGQSRAFRLTSGIMTDLGTLGGNYSNASAVSADGSVVVGEARNANSQSRAFRWTAGVMTNLGTLGGDYSNANAVSADSSVVVGQAYNASGQARAFRWTAGVMTDLGTLGGDFAYANAVSADGSVVAGYAYNVSNQARAFRWTAGVMTNLGTLGGDFAYANAISADGSVVVGSAYNASNQAHAFRWADGVMSDLGTFGGNYSSATAVSADGSVVVGYADNASGQQRAFIYRGRTLLDVDAWLASVGANNRIYNAGSMLAGMPLEGAHHRPMLSFDRMGKEQQVWATGDFGSSSRTRDVHVTTGEAGINWNLGKTSLLGFAAGHGIQNATLANEGSSATTGDYALVEYDYRPEGTQWIVSLLGMVGSWESKTRRGYITGTGTDFSVGVTDLITRTVRLRVDAPSLATFGGFGFAPYASYAVTQTTVAAYAETGGSFAASFEEQVHTAQEGRVGVSAAKGLSAATKLLLTVEAIHRFDGAGPALVGQETVGGIAFSQPGVAPRADCVRFGFDVDHKLSENTLLNVSAHVATVGEAHDVSAAISIRRAF